MVPHIVSGRFETGSSSLGSGAFIIMSAIKPSNEVAIVRGGEEGAARELSLSTVTFDMVAEDGKKKNTLLSLDRFFFQKWRRVGTLLYNNGFRVPHVEVQVPKLRLSA